MIPAARRRLPGSGGATARAASRPSLGPPRRVAPALPLAPRGRALAGGLFLALGLAWPAAPLRAEPAARGYRIYLPLAAAEPPLVCGSPRPGTCPGDAGWLALCGGVGELRDLFAPDDASGQVLGVGDGALRFRIARDAEGALVAQDWTPELGQELTGLNALFVLPGGRAGWSGWAVGDQGQVVPAAGACWTAHAPRARDLAVTWEALRLYRQSGALRGWAVGRQGADRAAILELTPGGWVDHAYAAARFPPLGDLALDPHPSFESDRPRAWALGADARRQAGVFLRSDDWGRWQLAQESAEGWPRELVMGADNGSGRAFGEAWPGGGALAWRLDLERPGWVLDSDFARPGRFLADVYGRVDPRQGDLEAWVGLSPAEGLPVIELSRGVDEAWAAIGPAPPIPPARAAAGAAIAVVRDLASAGDEPAGEAEGLVYSWGDGMWLLDLRRMRWSPLRGRERFVGLAPAAGGGWLLGAGEGGAAGLFAFDEGRIVPLAELGADLDPRLAGFRGRFMDRGGDRAWILGEGDAGPLGLRLQGPLGRPTVFAPAPEALAGGAWRGLDLAADGAAWALSRDAAGGQALWRFAPEGEAWERQDLPAGMPSSTALAALPGRRALVAGAGWSMELGGDCRGGDCGCGGEAAGPACRRALPAELGTASALVAGAGGEVWVAGGTPGDPRVARLSADRGWVNLPPINPPPGAGEPLLRFGARLAALAVGAPDDLWALARCGRAPAARALVCGDAEPFSSVLLHFDGRGWRAMRTLSLALDTIAISEAAGTRSLWAAGDWSTLVRFRYALTGD